MAAVAMMKRSVVDARDERGAIAGLVAMVGVLIVLLGLVLHFVVVGHVRHVVELHVDAGALAASSFDGTESDGTRRVELGLDADTGWIKEFTVTTTREPDFTTVVVRAEALSVVSFLSSEVVVERSVPTERPNS